MSALADRGMVLVACLGIMLLHGFGDGAGGDPAVDAPTGAAPAGAAPIVWLLIAVAVGAVCGAASRPVPRLAASGSCILVACWVPDALVGAPLVAYDLVLAVRDGGRRTLPLVSALVAAAGALGAVVLIGHGPEWEGQGRWATAAVAIALMAGLLALRTARADAVRTDLHRLRDDLSARLREFDASRSRLLEAQDLAARAATLDERTRIAREIHDSVGHLLTRLLLRVKALEVVHRDEPSAAADLAEVGSGLDEAMEAMRRSVHALSDDGEDLATALNTLGRRCGIGTVNVDCLLETDPPAAVTRCLVAVAREALTNAARHGRAASARVRVTDYPAFWQVSIGNDGLLPGSDDREDGAGVLTQAGLGLRSMIERVEALGGTVRVTPRPRFTVFATIPKDGRGEGE